MMIVVTHIKCLIVKKKLHYESKYIKKLLKFVVICAVKCEHFRRLKIKAKRQRVISPA